MTKPRRTSGFTLIEVMIVVAILSLLAAIAIPAFQAYLRRSRAAEASQMLMSIYGLAAAYYQTESSNRGITGSHQSSCVVGPADNRVTPGPSKAMGTYSDAAWKTLDFAMGYSYFRFEVDSVLGARCGVTRSTDAIYNLRARGDLDGDGQMSLYEVSVGSDPDNFLYHGRGFYIVDGLE